MPAPHRVASVVVETSHGPFARLRPVAVDAVRLEDAFWAPRRTTIREVTLPTQLEQLERTGRLDNFRRAAGTASGQHEGLYFNDSDVYKWLEAASWALIPGREATLERLVDEVIGVVGAAQQPDGYLDTYYQLGRGTGRWTELTRTHELYCAGHLIQAAVAHHRATGKSPLLDIACRFADLICDVLGPAESGRRPGTDGHEEIEMALVELARETGERRYLDQASYFIDARGHGLAGGDEYHQDHKPFRELDAMVGHAVRAVYLNAGAADLYVETGDPLLLAALERLWSNMTSRRIYVTGALGARYEGEAFGTDFELPNAMAYAETCAAIGSVMWNWRMLLATGDARYTDLLELTLYNAVLPGISLDGRAYFYENPLEDDGRHRRQPWFECACCPPNIARMVSSLPGYAYGTSGDAIWVHMYAQGSAVVGLPDGRVVELRQRTRYPWDGDIALEVHADGPLTLMLRIPSWCEADATLRVNDAPFPGMLQPGGYAEVRREWRPGDVVRLHLPMPARVIEAHPYLSENTGRVALQRGPLLYCAEQADNPGVDLRDAVIAAEPEILSEHVVELLGGVTILRAPGRVVRPDPDWNDQLYRPAGRNAGRAVDAEIGLMLVPYFAWANREPGQMRLWLRGDARDPVVAEV